MSTFKVNTLKDKFLEFEINEIDVSIVNAMRRVILAELKNYGFHFNAYTNSNINIITNTSPIHNEFLAHRISLIPICGTEKMIANRELDKYKFVLYKENNSNEIIDVTTQDFVVYDDNNNKIKTDELFPKNKITNDYILITKLRPKVGDKNQCVNIECIATIGNPKESICYSAISLCTFSNLIDTDQERKAIDNIKNNNSLSDVDKKMQLKKFETIERQRLFHKNEYHEPNRFNFLLESESGLSPVYIVNMSFDILKSKIIRLLDMNDHDIIEISSHETEDMLDVLIHGETHTVGNLLQSLIFNEYCRRHKEVKYIGYNVPHPLENDVIIKIKFTNNDMDVKDFLEKAFNHVINILQSLQDEWNNI